jgi:hypothetical protein
MEHLPKPKQPQSETWRSKLDQLKTGARFAAASLAVAGVIEAQSQLGKYESIAPYQDTLEVGNTEQYRNAAAWGSAEFETAQLVYERWEQGQLVRYPDTTGMKLHNWSFQLGQGEPRLTNPAVPADQMVDTDTIELDVDNYTGIDKTNPKIIVSKAEYEKIIQTIGTNKAEGILSVRNQIYNKSIASTYNLLVGAWQFNRYFANPAHKLTKGSEINALKIMNLTELSPYLVPSKGISGGQYVYNMLGAGTCGFWAALGQEIYTKSSATYKTMRGLPGELMTMTDVQGAEKIDPTKALFGTPEGRGHSKVAGKDLSYYGDDVPSTVDYTIFGSSAPSQSVNLTAKVLQGDGIYFRVIPEFVPFDTTTIETRLAQNNGNYARTNSIGHVVFRIEMMTHPATPQDVQAVASQISKVVTIFPRLRSQYKKTGPFLK